VALSFCDLVALETPQSKSFFDHLGKSPKNMRPAGGGTKIATTLCRDRVPSAPRAGLTSKHRIPGCVRGGGVEIVHLFLPKRPSQQTCVTGHQRILSVLTPAPNWHWRPRFILSSSFPLGFSLSPAKATQRESAGELGKCAKHSQASKPSGAAAGESS